MAARAALERDKKRFTAQRATLAAIERLRADVLRATAQPDAAWQAFAELKRWEPEAADKLTRALETALLDQSGHFGLALDALNARIKDDPADLPLREQRVALYERLGWGEAAAQERLHLARLALQRRLVQAL